VVTLEFLKKRSYTSIDLPFSIMEGANTPTSLNRVTSSLGLGMIMPSNPSTVGTNPLMANQQLDVQSIMNAAHQAAANAGMQTPTSSAGAAGAAGLASSVNNAAMMQQSIRRRMMPNEDMLWMPAHRPLVGGGAAAGF